MAETITRALRLAIAAVLGVLVVAGCSSAAGSAPSSDNVTARLAYTDGEVMPDACFMVSKQDVERMTGHKVVSAQAFLSDSPGCAYQEAGGLLLGTRFTKMTTQAPVYANAKARSDTVTVAGVGDEAIWIPSIRNLWIVKGDWMIAVGVGRIAADDVRFELAKQFAGEIVPKFG